ncbi:YebC/PmpR family DNA-binding transcriptional regulator [Candidatus Berkelbacteria bacterium]|nr:YebC/PmpR family DNA-binding transcriptional regulator [Candidatus Berkelbacteria bacterium]
MSGHSKWAQIKRKKGATDVKRGVLFGKLAKQITVAARLDRNLEIAINTARAANMPRENIERAIQRGVGNVAGENQIGEALYEAYAPGGTALLITVLTDNCRRTLGALRAIFNKYGVNLAQAGGVRHLFDYRGIVEVARGEDPDATQLALIEAGVDDVLIEDERVIGYTTPQNLESVTQMLKLQTIVPLETRFAFVPKMTIEIDEPTRDKLLTLLEQIDDLEDIDSVETNATL